MHKQSCPRNPGNGINKHVLGVQGRIGANFPLYFATKQGNNFGHRNYPICRCTQSDEAGNNGPGAFGSFGKRLFVIRRATVILKYRVHLKIFYNQYMKYVLKMLK